MGPDLHYAQLIERTEIAHDLMVIKIGPEAGHFQCNPGPILHPGQGRSRASLFHCVSSLQVFLGDILRINTRRKVNSSPIGNESLRQNVHPPQDQGNLRHGFHGAAPFHAGHGNVIAPLISIMRQHLYEGASDH